MKLRFTRRAVQDLADIADYIRKQNPQAALRVRAALESFVIQERWPESRRVTDVDGKEPEAPITPCFDSSATKAVLSGNGFDACFSPYQATRLKR
jgi:ParE toxin of type II toxin-antitoxin system, parDE